MLPPAGTRVGSPTQKDQRRIDRQRRNPVHDIEPLERLGLSRCQLLLQQQMLAEQAGDHQHDRDVVHPGDDDGPGQDTSLRDKLWPLTQDKDRAGELTRLT